jgi:hypothetical protein
MAVFFCETSTQHLLDALPQFHFLAQGLSGSIHDDAHKYQHTQESDTHATVVALPFVGHYSNNKVKLVIF